MTPQDQTLFGGADAPPELQGNCFAACVATILNTPLADLPNFCAAPPSEWFELANEYLIKHFNHFLVRIVGSDRSGFMHPDALTIASGPGPRGHRHCVVYDGHGMVHDPHPSRAGLDPEDHYVFVLCR